MPPTISKATLPVAPNSKSSKGNNNNNSRFKIEERIRQVAYMLAQSMTETDIALISVLYSYCLRKPTASLLVNLFPLQVCNHRLVRRDHPVVISSSSILISLPTLAFRSVKSFCKSGLATSACGVHEYITSFILASSFPHN